MLKGKQFICDLCGEPIEAKEVVEVCTVDSGCRSTKDVVLYLHLYTDRSSKYSEYYGGKGCYREWTDGSESFTPCSVRKVTKKEILKNAL